MPFAPPKTPAANPMPRPGAFPFQPNMPLAPRTSQLTGVGMNSNIAQAGNLALQNPNPAGQLRAPQTALATPQGVAQTAKTADLRALPSPFLLLAAHARPHVKAADVQTGGASAPAAGASAPGNAAQTATSGPAKAAPMLGTAPNAAAGQNPNPQPGGVPGVAQPGVNRGGVFAGQQVGAYGVVQPGWNALKPMGPVANKAAEYLGLLPPAVPTYEPPYSPAAGYAAGATHNRATTDLRRLLAAYAAPSPTVGGAHSSEKRAVAAPVPGLTANAPVPPPGMPPAPPASVAPPIPPPNGGAPIPGGMGQPSLDPVTGQPLAPPPGQPGVPAGAQPGAAQAPAQPAPPPTQPDPVTGMPATSPMQDPPPLPLPSNPRMTPPRPPMPHDAAGAGVTGGLMADKVRADVPAGSGEAAEDMQAEAAALGSKTASWDVRLVRELGAAARLAVKRAAQADTRLASPARSATGESAGLSLATKKDHHATGQAAWASVSAYFSGHKTRKDQPDPGRGKHAADGGVKTGFEKLAVPAPLAKALAAVFGAGPRATLGLGRWEALPPDLGRRAARLMARAHPDRHVGDPAALARFRATDRAYQQLAGRTPRFEAPLFTREGLEQNKVPLVAAAGAGAFGGGVTAGHALTKRSADLEKTAVLGRVLSLFGRGAAKVAPKAPAVAPAASTSLSNAPTAVLRPGAVAKAYPKPGDLDRPPLEQVRSLSPLLHHWLTTGQRVGWSAAPVAAGGVATNKAAAAKTGFEKAANPALRPLAWVLEQGQRFLPGAGNFARGLFGGAKPIPVPQAPAAGGFRAWSQSANAVTQNAQRSRQLAASPAMRAGSAVNQAAGRAWNAVPAGARGQVGMTAGGGLLGGSFGDATPFDTGSTLGNAAAGAAAFNPWVHRLGLRRGAAGLTNVPVRAAQGGILGGSAGGFMDAIAGWGGLRDAEGNPTTNFRQLGGSLGTGFGGLSGTGRALRGLAAPGGQAHQLGARMAAFGEGGLAPLRAPFTTLGRGLGVVPRAAQPGMTSVAGAARGYGRVAGLGAAGVLGANATIEGGKRYAAEQARDMADAYLAERLPQIQGYLGEQATGIADQYLDRLGLLNQQGQFDAMGAVRRGAANSADALLASLGLDPANMSGLQKMMILGGAGLGGAGALAGSPVAAGAGGLSALAGLLPQFMPSQGQHLPGLPQRPYTPGQAHPPGQGGGVNQPQAANVPGARNEFAHQRRLQGA